MISKKVYFKKERDMISCNISMSLSRCNCSNDLITKYVNQQDCIPYGKSALTTLFFFITQHKFSFLIRSCDLLFYHPNNSPDLRLIWQLLISVLCPLQLTGEIFWNFICVDTHLPRIEALAYVVPHFDPLISASGDSWSYVPVFVKRCSSFSCSSSH